MGSPCRWAIGGLPLATGSLAVGPLRLATQLLPLTGQSGVPIGESVFPVVELAEALIYCTVDGCPAFVDWWSSSSATSSSSAMASSVGKGNRAPSWRVARDGASSQCSPLDTVCRIRLARRFR